MVFASVQRFESVQMTTEKTITNKILSALNNLPGCRAVKIHSGAMQGAGLADITGCYKGRAFWIEVKKPGELPTKLQAFDLYLWGRSGAIVGYATNVVDAVDIVVNPNLPNPYEMDGKR